MKIFEIKEIPSFSHRMWSELYLLLFFNLGLIVGAFDFFSKHYLIIEFFVFAIFLLQGFSKRNRQVYKLTFNDQQKKLIIHYFQFVKISYANEVPYERLNFEYRNKLYGRRKIAKTIELKEEGEFIVEIRQKYNIGWTNEMIDDMYGKLQEVKKKVIIQ